MSVHLGSVMELPVWRDSHVIVQLVQCLRRQEVNCDAVIRPSGKILGRYCVIFPLDVTPD